jgi:hypothetical protein
MKRDKEIVVIIRNFKSYMSFTLYILQSTISAYELL